VTLSDREKGGDAVFCNNVCGIATVGVSPVCIRAKCCVDRSRSEDIEMNGPRAKMMRSSEHDGPSLWICIFHLFST